LKKGNDSSKVGRRQQGLYLGDIFVLSSQLSLLGGVAITVRPVVQHSLPPSFMLYQHRPQTQDQDDLKTPASGMQDTSTP
jgi:hypothetical protein